MVNQLKKWWQSKAILGVLTMLVGVYAPKVGLDLDENAVTAILDQLAIVGGAIMAIYGRVVASKRIG